MIGNAEWPGELPGCEFIKGNADLRSAGEMSDGNGPERSERRCIRTGCTVDRSRQLRPGGKDH